MGPAAKEYRPGWRNEAAFGGGGLYDWGSHFVDQLWRLLWPARPVRLFRHVVDCLELLLRIDKAFVTPRNVVVDLNPKDVAVLCARNNLVGVVELQTVRPNAHVVRPVLPRRIRSGQADQRN